MLCPWAARAHVALLNGFLGKSCLSIDLFIILCDFLGIPIAPDKTFDPLTTLTFAGIELDSLKWEARFPKDKIEVRPMHCQLFDS